MEIQIEKQLLYRIKALVFDYDGVFTDNRILLLPDGEMVRQANVRDGFVLRHAIEQGFPVAIITGGTSEAIKTRFEFLGVRDVFIGVRNKLETLQAWASENQIRLDNIMYMGDDIPDLEVMNRVLLPCCPADAVEEVVKTSRYRSDKNGGDGCVRDIVEQILRTQNKWPW